MHTQEVLQNNPFNFKHFSASQMAIYLNWDVSVPSLELNFVDKQQIGEYRSLFATAGRANKYA